MGNYKYKTNGNWPTPTDNWYQFNSHGVKASEFVIKQNHDKEGVINRGRWNECFFWDIGYESRHNAIKFYIMYSDLTTNQWYLMQFVDRADFEKKCNIKFEDLTFDLIKDLFEFIPERINGVIIPLPDPNKVYRLPEKHFKHNFECDIRRRETYRKKILEHKDTIKAIQDAIDVLTGTDINTPLLDVLTQMQNGTYIYDHSVEESLAQTETYILAARNLAIRYRQFKRQTIKQAGKNKHIKEGRDYDTNS